MRTIPIAVAALTLMSAAALAQTTPSSPSRPASPSSGATMAPAKPPLSINPLTQEDISKIEGQTILGGDDAKIGHVSNVLMDPKSKQIDRLVVAAGGLLGIGSHRVAIPVDQFTWDGERSVFKLQKDVAALKSMPEWVEGATATATGTSQPAKQPASTGAGNSDLK